LFQREGASESTAMAGSKGNRRKKAGKHKARPSLKERASDLSESSDQLFEEITALSAIFQDDFNLISEHPVAEFSIHIRPHSVDDNGIEENISAELVVRYAAPIFCPLWIPSISWFKNAELYLYP
jgi:hypothetical protein